MPESYQAYEDEDDNTGADAETGDEAVEESNDAESYNGSETKNDVKYVVEKVWKQYRHQCSRKAVLTPILGHTRWIQRGQMQSIAVALQQMRNIWCRQLKQLWLAAWEPVTRLDKNYNTANWYFYRNCPPTGVDTQLSGRQLHTCTRNKLCPFCYQRDYVLRGFQFFEDRVWLYLAGLPEDKRADYWWFGCRLEKGYRLRESSMEYAAGTAARIADDGFADTIDERDKERELRIMQPRFAVVLNTIAPSMDGLSLTYTRSAVMLMPHRRDMHFVLSDDCRGKTWNGAVTKRELSRIMSEAFAYPKALLHSDRADLVAGVQNGLLRKQMIHEYGELPKKH